MHFINGRSPSYVGKPCSSLWKTHFLVCLLGSDQPNHSTYSTDQTKSMRGCFKWPADTRKTSVSRERQAVTQNVPTLKTLWRRDPANTPELEQESRPASWADVRKSWSCPAAQEHAGVEDKKIVPAHRNINPIMFNGPAAKYSTKRIEDIKLT